MFSCFSEQCFAILCSLVVTRILHAASSLGKLFIIWSHSVVDDKSSRMIKQFFPLISVANSSISE
jgi:hypothetical protein